MFLRCLHPSNLLCCLHPSELYAMLEYIFFYAENDFREVKFIRRRIYRVELESHSGAEGDLRPPVDSLEKIFFPFLLNIFLLRYPTGFSVHFIFLVLIHFLKKIFLQESRENPSAPQSPLHPEMYSDGSGAWHDNNMNVHPLPHPPGPAVHVQPSFSHQNVSKNEGALMTSQWQKQKLIGSGAFGNVYKAINKYTGALCAMKEVNIIPDNTKSTECLKQLKEEIRVLSKLKHPNIVQYYGSELTEDHLYIFLEYVYPGSINKYVQEHYGAMTESVVRSFTRQILKGLAYLHSTDNIHRDIKGANLLVDVNGVVKLADFGLVKHFSTAATLSSKGTAYWMAPEVILATGKDVGYDFAVDIWSLGCTIIEMFTGKHPWSEFEWAAAMFQAVTKDPPIPENLSSEGKDFLQRCFRRNPAERPTANMLLDHPFIWKSNSYNLHDSSQALAGLKLNEITYSPRKKFKSKSEPLKKGRHSG